MTLLFICIGAVALFAIILWAVLASGPAGAKNPDGSFPNQSAQTGTNATPPVGGVAAGQQRDSPTRGTTREARQTNGWDILWRVLKFGLILLVIWFGWRAWQSDGFQKRFVQASPFSNKGKHLEYHYTTMGPSGVYTAYSVDVIDRKKAGEEFQTGFRSRPPEGAPLFEVNRRKVCHVCFPNKSIGDTLHFQCWGRRHECLGPGSDHRKDPFKYLRNGRFDWVVGQPWSCNNVVVGTEVLHVWNDSLDGSVKIKFMEEK